MLFTSFFITLTLSFAASVNGAAIASRAALDVFVPHITSPDAATTWIIGHIETVTWDASDAPVNISNGASVVLDGVGVLAKDFDLRAGKVNVTVPANVTAGQYTITLFGDSGNTSPPFDIVPCQE